MKLLLVNRPLQNENTPLEEQEHVEFYQELNTDTNQLELKKYVPTWCVDTHIMSAQFDIKNLTLS